MRWRGPIVNSLISLAAAGFLSACAPHHHGHGTVYRPHDHGVRTGPVRTHTHTTTRTTVIAPHRGRPGHHRYRKGRRHRGPGHTAPPATAKRPHPPAHGLHGTQPGHLKRNKGPNMPASGAARAPYRQGGQPRTPDSRTPQPPHTVSSAMNQLQKKRQATTSTEPKSTILSK